MFWKSHRGRPLGFTRREAMSRLYLGSLQLGQNRTGRKDEQEHRNPHGSCPLNDQRIGLLAATVNRKPMSVLDHYYLTAFVGSLTRSS